MIKQRLNFRLCPKAGCLLLFCVVTARAGYKIDVQVESAPGTNRYTWVVHNEDQSWGLDQFVIEVPVQTRVLACMVPPPYSNPDGNAYWIMQERQEPWVDPHDSRTVSPRPRAGWKCLMWHGMESPSVYPPGTTATFSLTTDSSVKPGVVHAMTVSYTPQDNPHYYFSWQEETTGPSTVARIGGTDINPINILAGPVVNPANGHAYYLLAQNTWSNAEAQAVRLGGHLATIRNAEEDQWVYSTFGPYGGALWIGLTDREKVFSFNWTSGEPVSYTDWGGGQPDNGNGVEFYVHMLPRGHYAAGKWNDYANADTVLAEQFPLYGVAEISPTSTVKLELSASSNQPEAQRAASLITAQVTSPELRAFSAIELCWASEVNKAYRVQWTSSLEQPQWVNLEPRVIGTGSTVSIFDSAREHPQGFYRVQIVQ